MSLSIGTLTGRLELDDQMSKSLSAVQGHLQQTSSAIGMMIGTMGGFVGASMAMAAVGQVFTMAKDAVIGMNATLETSELKFATLMKDADAARAHVAFLFEFAKKTPFETGPILEASIKLQTFGGAALNTQQNLTLLGDASAAVGAPFEQLGTWVGRMYSALKGGQPFGEAAMRLQEMAVLTPQARKALEDIAKTSATTEEKFAVLQKALGEFAGSMEKQAGTWTGVVSTFKDSIGIMSAQAMKPLFELLRDGIAKMNEFLSSEKLSKWVGDMATAVGKVVTEVRRIAEAFSEGADATEAALLPIIEHVQRWSDSLQQVVTQDLSSKLAGPLSEVRDMFEQIADSVMSNVGPAVDELAEAMAGPAWSAVRSMYAAIADVVVLLWNVFKDLAVGVWLAIEPLASPTWSAIKEIASALFKVIGVGFDIVGAFARAALDLWDKLNLGEVAIAGVTAILGPLVTALIAVVEGMGWLANKVGFVADKIRWLMEVSGVIGVELPKVAPVANGVGSAFDDLAGRAGKVGDVMDNLNIKSDSVAGTGLPKVEDATNKVTDAMKKAALKVQALADALSGKKLGEDVDELEKAWKKLTPVEQANIAVIDRMLEKYLALRDAGAKLSAPLEALLQIYGRVPPKVNEATIALRANQQTMQDILDQSPKLGPELLTSRFGIKQSTTEFVNGLTKSFQGLWITMDEVGKLPPKIETNVISLGDEIEDNLAKAVSNIPQIIIDAFTGGGGMWGALRAIGVSLVNAFVQPFITSLGKQLASAVANAGVNAATKRLLAGMGAEGAATKAGSLTWSGAANAAPVVGVWAAIAIGWKMQLDANKKWLAEMRAEADSVMAIIAENWEIATAAVSRYGVAMKDLKPDKATKLLLPDFEDFIHSYQQLATMTKTQGDALRAMAPDVHAWAKVYTDAGLTIPPVLQKMLDDLKGIEDAQGNLIETAEQVANRMRGMVDAFVGSYAVQKDSVDTATAAGLAYEEMAASGKYSAEVLKAAWLDWQSALAVAGDTAAKVNIIIAGYAKRTDLVEAANLAGAAYKKMVADGVYGTAELEAAAEEWEQALIRAGDAGAIAAHNLAEGLAQYQTIAKQVESADSLGAVYREMVRLGTYTQRDLVAAYTKWQDAIRATDADAMPSLADITAAAERYGIELDDLGPKVAQLSITDAAKTMADDFRMLTLAGADMGNILGVIGKAGDYSLTEGGMGDQINDLLKRAQETGAKIPEALRPAIEAMIRSGTLLDENGKKVTDIGSIKFEQDPMVMMNNSIRDLVNTMRELNGLPPIIDTIAPGMTRVEQEAKAAADAAAGLSASALSNATELKSRLDKSKGAESPWKDWPSAPALPDYAAATADVDAPWADWPEPPAYDFSHGPAETAPTTSTAAQVLEIVGAMTFTSHTTLNIDGKTAAKAIAPYLPGVLKKSGV
jgi:hypothetical protein